VEGEFPTAVTSSTFAIVRSRKLLFEHWLLQNDRNRWETTVMWQATRKYMDHDDIEQLEAEMRDSLGDLRDFIAEEL
jgi:hypothetical protein